MVEIKKLKPLFKSGWRSRLYKGHEWAGNDYVMYDIGQPLDGEKHSSLFGMKPESVRDDVGLIADGVKGSPITPVAVMNVGGRKLAVFEAAPGMAVFAKAEFVAPVAPEFSETDNTFFLDGGLIRVRGAGGQLTALICIFKPARYDADKLADRCERVAGLMREYIRHESKARTMEGGEEMKHFIESEWLTDALRELCGKYNIACGDDSQGLGKELMELPKRLSYLCTSEKTTEALDVMAGRELVTLRSGCCKEPMCVGSELWRISDGVYCPKCGIKVLKPRAMKGVDSER